MLNESVLDFVNVDIWTHEAEQNFLEQRKAINNKSYVAAGFKFPKSMKDMYKVRENYHFILNYLYLESCLFRSAQTSNIGFVCESLTYIVVRASNGHSRIVVLFQNCLYNFFQKAGFFNQVRVGRWKARVFSFLKPFLP